MVQNLIQNPTWHIQIGRRDEAPRSAIRRYRNRRITMYRSGSAGTPALCASYGGALTKLATSDEPYEAVVGERIKRQMPNIRYLLAGHCDLASALDAAETRANKVAGVNPATERSAKVHATLEMLRHGN